LYEETNPRVPGEEGNDVTEGAGVRAGDVPEDLTAAEAGMWQAFRNGSVYDLSSGDPLVDCSSTARPPWPAGCRH
jgi:hypothetical protein